MDLVVCPGCTYLSERDDFRAALASLPTTENKE